MEDQGGIALKEIKEELEEMDKSHNSNTCKNKVEEDK